MLAFSFLQKNEATFPNLRVLGFNDEKDHQGMDLWREILKERAIPKRSLYNGEGHFNLLRYKHCTLIEHNNSDGFGFNIGTEGNTSKDGCIGCFSDASLALNPQRFADNSLPYDVAAE
jgi:hypothetical protein